MTEATDPQPVTESAGPREIGAMVLRIAVAVSALLLVYFQMPVDNRGDVAFHVGVVVVGIAVFGVIFLRQMRRIRRAQFPVLRAVEAIALVATLFVVVMSSVHYGLGQSDPAGYSEALSRLDALYFTVTTLATVGFGDITPVSEATRAVTTVQMVLGVALLGAGIRSLLGVARMVAEERRSTSG